MPRARRAAGSVVDKHHQAVMNTLSWADQSAAGGDYADALAWLDIITAIGDELPDPYPAKQAAWRAAIRAAGAPDEAQGDEQGRTSRRSDFKTARAAA